MCTHTHGMNACAPACSCNQQHNACNRVDTGHDMTVGWHSMVVVQWVEITF